MRTETIIQRDLKHNWHPCSQMKDYEQYPPLLIEKAEGIFLQLNNGKKIIDGISSWWCKSLGHAHPQLQLALHKQLKKFEHVIFSGTTYEAIIELSERLIQIMPHLNKVFYASDGSSAIEIAMKMSLHARAIQQTPRKNKFIALKNAYHGETLGALSVSDAGLYRLPYQAHLFHSYFIEPLYVTNEMELDDNILEKYWRSIEKKLLPIIENCTAIIVEPLVQGAAGMKLYSSEFLKKLFYFSKQHDVHFIADEIMTGIGRTGKWMACEHANIQPDFICLGKGLTAGFLPFSAVMTTQDIFNNFYDDYETGRAFLHSHTYSGHALSAAVALEVLNIIQEDNLIERVNHLGKYMFEKFSGVARRTNKLIHIRQIGAIVAGDLICEPHSRTGYFISQEAIKQGALLRPLGNTLYWLPPFNTDFSMIDQLAEIMERAITAVLK